MCYNTVLFTVYTCDVCYDEKRIVTLECSECKMKMCDPCEEKWHNHPKRVGHKATKLAPKKSLGKYGTAVITCS